jgi:hypothetical protein
VALVVGIAIVLAWIWHVVDAFRPLRHAELPPRARRSRGYSGATSAVAPSRQTVLRLARAPRTVADALRLERR